MVVILIALLTNTNLGTYNSVNSCQSAIRAIYTQRIDPYGYMDQRTRKQVVDLQMKYAAPKEYRCQIS